jgi:hypothetical protein
MAMGWVVWNSGIGHIGAFGELTVNVLNVEKASLDCSTLKADIVTNVHLIGYDPSCRMPARYRTVQWQIFN